MVDQTTRINQLEDQVRELTARLAVFEARTGFMSAETMLENAKAWIARNPKAWSYLKRMAHYSITNQQRFSIKRELEALREADGVSVGEDDYKISNSYSAVFVRLLVDEMPELRELVSLRPSKVDRFFSWRKASR